MVNWNVKGCTAPTRTPLPCPAPHSSRRAGPALWTGIALLALLGSACRVAAPAVPTAARRLNNQGVVYMDQHNYTRAREEFAQALTLAPDYALARANLGIAYYSLGKYDSSATALRAALSLDDKLLPAHYTLGLIANAQGREYDQALQSLIKVRDADPGDPLVRYYLGQVEAKLGRGDDAVASLKEATRLDPLNVSAYYALAAQYRQQGRENEWKDALATFSRLNQAGYKGVTSGYQGQGRYAEAMVDTVGGQAHTNQPPATWRWSGQAVGVRDGIRDAVTVDYDHDGNDDLLVLTDRVWRAAAAAGGLGQPTDLGIPASGLAGATRLVAADLDNDGDVDLVTTGPVTRLWRQESGAWVEVDLAVAGTTMAAIADVDHDGDLDLLLAAATGTRLLRNDGRATFGDVTSAAGLAGSLAARQIVASDLDSDRDVDLLLLGDSGVQLWTNNRDGSFSETAAAFGLADLGGATCVAVEDLNRDGQMDVAALTADGTVRLLLNQQGRRFAVAASAATGLSATGQLLAADGDLDGTMDLLVLGDRAAAMVEGDDRGVRITPLTDLAGDGGGPAVVIDGDSDGRPDLWRGGTWWRNQTAAGHWLRVWAQGKASNHDGLGTKIEVRTAAGIQKRELRAPGPLTFGLGAADSVEFVRLLWPGGVRQTELAMNGDRMLTLTELDRKGTSCPVVYVWDGTRFRFVSDINGGAIIGYLAEPGRYAPSDTDEYLPLGPMAPRDGSYVVQLGNHLEEVIYVDALQLVAVDHPRGVTVFPNERLLSAPPFPAFRLYPVGRRQPIVGAIDHRGRDVRAALAAVDDQWYDGFTTTDIHGYAEDFSLTLDLGDLSAFSHPLLIAHGWVDYAHSTSNWAASQRGWSLSPPRLEVADGRGGWRLVTTDMGTPAGLPKDMVYDLQGVFPSRDHRLRLSSNLAVYWDAFAVGEVVEAPLTVHRLKPHTADLHWRGYPDHTAIHGTFAFRYDYDRVSTDAPWGTHGGSYTRYGGVSELLAAADDRYAIMLHGDEVTARFDAASLPPLPSGTERSFMLYSDGFGKDMDLHSAASLTVEPLPFHGMSAYPYPPGETYPGDAEHAAYQREYNDRRLEGYYR